MRAVALAIAGLVTACTGVIGQVGSDAPAVDARATAFDAVPDAAPDAAPDARPQPECEWGGAPGSCLSAQSCAALGDRTLESGTCAATLGCCIITPDVRDNPPIPAGWMLMKQADVTADMTSWAVMILHDHVDYPMFATTTMLFGDLTVMARVEWHAPDFQNSIVHRGVTLYQPI